MKKILLAFLTVAAIVTLFVPKVWADVNDFVINDFHGRYELSNDVHAGKLTVTETIKLTYSDNNHGILRAIPTDYSDNSLRLDVLSVKRDGQKEPFTTYGEAGNEVLKIGDADKTITGEHTYEIHYVMNNIISFYDEYDEWYWDINGDQWQQQFLSVRGEVILPEGWSTENIPGASCFTGKYGSTASVCNISKTATGYTFESFRPLAANETLSVAIPFQKGLFTPRDKTDWFRDNAWQLAGLVTSAILSVFAFRQWWLWGKDHKGKGTIVPEYEPPKGLTPAEVGMLYDYNVDSRDLTATLIDLAIRGYIKVYDEEKKTLKLFTSHTFTLELTKASTTGLHSHETALLEAVFGGLKQGAKKNVSKISRSKMQSTVTKVRKDMKERLTKDYGLLEETPKRPLRYLWGMLGLVVLLFFVTGGGWGWLSGLIIVVVVIVTCLVLMRRRSHAGVETYEKIQGLKLYMDTAEKDRLKMMESVDRPYSEPTKDVVFFEKLLPFAVALGVEQSWAKQFDNIYREPPQWYGGNMATFNTVYFTNSLAGSVSALNTSFSPPSSSSGSGSGGGGFSGGGGGGGGGGGW